MKTIEGKKYYVSIGYIDDEEVKQVDAKSIKSLIMDSKSKDGTVYIDDSDKDNIIRLPLIPVNEIQKKDDVFKFRVLIYPFKLKWVDNKEPSLFKINVVGLFSSYVENGVEHINLVSFYKSKTQLCKLDSSKTFDIEAKASKILGGKAK